tara:strand:+ start:510 stop:1352 length:843 start_codon:yes stop_codon:yes gene_type:complete
MSDNKNTFSHKGYKIIRNAISPKLIKETQIKILEKINSKIKIQNKSDSELYKKFKKTVDKLKNNEFQFISKISNHLIYSNQISKLLKEKKIIKFLKETLGNDLSHINDPHILSINLPSKNDAKKNYFFKDWHQEIWSGSNIRTIQLWTPIFQKGFDEGQIEIIENSHQWGHVPHKNRSPINLPNKFKTKKIKLNKGDVIFFSTLLLHRSLKCKNLRLASPILIKNFKDNTYSFDNNRNWIIFSYSEMTKIERVLGNHYLSPYRIEEADIGNLIDGTIKKK